MSDCGLTDEPLDRTEQLRAMTREQLRELAEGYGLLSPRHLVRLIAEHEAAQEAQVAALHESLARRGVL